MTAAPAPVVSDSFVWTREPRLAWTTALHRLRPLTDHTSGLVIAWIPGDPWEPVQRWGIFEAFPKGSIPDTVLQQLEGPHPRSKGHGCFGTNEYGTWCLCPRPRHHWVDGPAPGITRQMWELYRKHGAWCRTLWIVQGEHGGHKYRYTDWESRLARLAGLPPQPPAAGDLPYAEPDERTWDCLAVYADPTLLKVYRGLTEHGLRRPGDFDATDKAAAEFAARQVLKSFGAEVAEHADELCWALRRADQRTAHVEEDRTDMAAEQEATLQRLTETLTGTL